MQIETLQKITTEPADSRTFEAKAKEMTIRERRADKQASKQHKQTGRKSPEAKLESTKGQLQKPLSDRSLEFQNNELRSQVLIKHFMECPFWDYDTEKQISEELGMTLDEVQIWNWNYQQSLVSSSKRSKINIPK